MIEESIFIELIHLFAKFYKDIDLTWFREKGKLSVCDNYYTSLDFIIFFVIESTNSEPDSHILKKPVFVDSFTIKILLDFIHVSAWH